jgi:hypothetical protein
VTNRTATGTVVAVLVAVMTLVVAGPVTPHAAAATPGTLSGTVIGTTGPLGNVYIQVWRLVDPTKESGSRICYRSSSGQYDGPYYYPLATTALTDESGQYLVPDIPAGTYAVSASPEKIGPDNFYFGRWYGGHPFVTQRYALQPGPYIGFCPSGQSTATVKAGANTALTTISLALGGLVTGTIGPAAADTDTTSMFVNFGSTPGGYTGAGHAESVPPYSYTTKVVLPPGSYVAEASAQVLDGSRADYASGGKVTVTAGQISTYSVNAGRITPATTPRLSGSAVVGKKISVTATSWAPTAAVSYYWQPAWRNPNPCGIDTGVARRSATLLVPSTVKGCRLEAVITATAAHYWNYDQVLTSPVVIAAPGKPRTVQVTTGAGATRVTWRAPTATNGAAVTSYQWRVKAQGRWKAWTTTTHRWFTRKSRAASIFQVRAVNRAGAGAAVRGTLPRR